MRRGWRCWGSRRGSPATARKRAAVLDAGRAARRDPDPSRGLPGVAGVGPPGPEGGEVVRGAGPGPPQARAGEAAERARKGERASTTPTDARPWSCAGSGWSGCSATRTPRASPCPSRRRSATSPATPAALPVISTTRRMRPPGSDSPARGAGECGRRQCRPGRREVARAGRAVRGMASACRQPDRVDERPVRRLSRCREQCGRRRDPGTRGRAGRLPDGWPGQPSATTQSWTA